jgi:AcrR family transcriptional regulator
MRLFGRPTVKEQQQKVREDAIIDATHALLARKGYDLMTVDEVAAEAGIAKASLYKHFDSKESLAAVAMIRLLERALAFLGQLPADMQSLDKLRSVLNWALELRLQGGLPLLPSTSQTLQRSLLSNRQYVTRLLNPNEQMSALVRSAQAQGTIDPGLPVEVVLFSIYARTCDPAVEYLKMTGKYSDREIADHLLRVAFDGITNRG